MHTSSINDEGMYEYSLTNPSFYNLQMYSNSADSSSRSLSSQNLYQNLQEVSYHHSHQNTKTTKLSEELRPSTIISHKSPTFRTTAISNDSIVSHVSISDKSDTRNHVRKGSIVFTNPFTSATPPESELIYSKNSRNINRCQPVDRSHSSHISSESINCQPIYANFGKESVFVTCPYCHHTDETDIEVAIGSASLIWACIIPCLGFILKSKRDVRHRCKNCLNVIGTHFP